MGSKIGRKKISWAHRGKYPRSKWDRGTPFIKDSRKWCYVYPKNKVPNDLQKSLWNKHKADYIYKRTFKKYYKHSKN